MGEECREGGETMAGGNLWKLIKNGRKMKADTKNNAIVKKKNVKRA